jgi:hypothetical protein
MKKCAVFLMSLALLGSTALLCSAKDDKAGGQTLKDSPPTIEDPSGVEAPPAPPVVAGAVPPAPTATPAAEAQANVTVTISRVITNPPNAITIIGMAASEQEKQNITAKLQEAVPGRTINNQLVISGQGIVEPSGAEQGSAKHHKSGPK